MGGVGLDALGSHALLGFIAAGIRCGQLGSQCSGALLCGLGGGLGTLGTLGAGIRCGQLGAAALLLLVGMVEGGAQVGGALLDLLGAGLGTLGAGGGGGQLGAQGGQFLGA